MSRSAATPPGDGILRTASRNGHHVPDVYGPSGRSPWLDVDWREHQRWVRLPDGQALNVIDLGEGPPIVFVHGLSGSWPNWLEQLPVFAGITAGDGESALGDGSELDEESALDDGSAFGGHRVIAMDMPGFGHSPMPPAGQRITISHYARVLDALMASLGIDAAAVVGNSMGGFTAAELAIAFPQRVERLVLVSPAGLSTYRHPRGTQALPRLQRYERFVAAYTAWLAAHSDAATRRPLLRDAALGLVTAHPSRLPAALAAEQLRGAGKPGFIEGLEANLDYDFRQRLPEIACPTLIVWGDRDRVITVRDAAVFAELIPGSRKVIYEDTGHMAQIERPQAFNALLGEFLSE